MRYFASALAVTVAPGDDAWTAVRPFKLTATSWAHDKKQGFVGSLPGSCKLVTSSGPHPVEYVSGKCFSKTHLDELRRPKGQVQLWARKFGPGLLPNLLDLNYV